MPSGRPVSLYLLHVPLGGALALPVATGLAGGAQQQGGQFVYPLRGGDGAGRRRRGRRCGAQPVIPPQHWPQHPRVFCPLPAPRVYRLFTPRRRRLLGAPFFAKLRVFPPPPPPPRLPLSVFLFVHPRRYTFPLRGGDDLSFRWDPRYVATLSRHQLPAN